MDLTNFKQIEDRLSAGGRLKTIAVAMATDHTTQSAVARALAAGVAKAVFVGAVDHVRANAEIMRHEALVRFVDASDVDDAAAKAVALIREGEADVLMKGMLNTDNLLRAVLNKQQGILSPGGVLTHLTVAEIPAYHKLLMFTDAAVIPYPTGQQREAQLRYVLDFARKIGIERPKVALVHCSEKVDERHFPFTADYVKLRSDADAGMYGPCVVDGPLDVKTSCSKAALEKKGIDSPVDGDADALIFPDIESGNAFYKTITLFAGGSCAGMLCGCTAPVVLPSRGDSVESKYNSLLIAMNC